jgi:hypothetical protein
MKIVALIASYDRDMILRDCLKCIMPQVDDIVLVGSSGWVEGANGSPVEKNIAKELGLVYVDHKNRPLGQKWQAGLNKCRELEPDAVLICGSDDLLKSNYVEEGIWDCNCWISGVDAWNIMLVISEDIKIVKVKYKKREDFIGAGRIISKELLDRVNWQIFPSEALGCDIYSWCIMRPYMGCQHYNRSEIMCVKGSWEMLDSWKQIIESESLNRVLWYNNKNEIKNLLNSLFPEIDFKKYTQSGRN